MNSFVKHYLIIIIPVTLFFFFTGYLISGFIMNGLAFAGMIYLIGLITSIDLLNS